MAATWPIELPTGFLEGAEEERYEDNVLASAMDTGPAKVRRRTTASPSELSGVIFLDTTQKIIFDTFWRQVVRSGSEPFYFMTALLRFKPHEPPRATTVRTAEGLHYRVTIILERLP